MATLTIQPGSFLILDHSSAHGGTRYSRTREVSCLGCGAPIPRAADECPACGSRGERADIDTVRTVADKAIVRDGNNLVQSAVRSLLRRLTVQTPIGCVCAPEVLPELETGYARIAEDAESHNLRARAARVDQTVRIGMVAMEITPDHASVADYLTQHVVDALSDLHNALRDGAIGAVVDNALRPVKALPRCAHGRQRETLQRAVDGATIARKALLTAAKESGLAGDHTGETDAERTARESRLAAILAAAGAALDLGAIERAIDSLVDDDATIVDEVAA